MTEASRYSRQVLIEGWNQERINHAKVAVIGVGALGSMVAANLAMIGTKKIILVDDDTIEVSNLSRQLLFTSKDIGSPKVKAAATKLLAINPEVEIVTIQDKVENVPVHAFKDVDCIVEGLDTFEARRYVNSLAIALKKPLVSGGIYAFHGNVQVIIPHETPCLECQPLIPIDRLQKSCTRPQDGEDIMTTPLNDSHAIDGPMIIPTVAPVATVIGGIMAQECVKLILGLPPLREYLFWDARTQSFLKIPLHRRPNCFVCSDTFKIQGIPLSLSLKESVREFQERVKILFNLKNPSIAIESHLLESKELEKTFKELFPSDQARPILFVFDDGLAKPLKIQGTLID